MTHWLFIGAISVVVSDTLASIAARALDFDYGSLWPLSLILAVTIAFLVGRDTGSVRASVLVGLVLRFTDATIGLAVSWVIGPGAPATADRDAVLVVVTALLVTGLGVVEGLVGGWLGVRFSRRRSTQTAA